jgi:hypothetical protein
MKRLLTLLVLGFTLAHSQVYPIKYPLQVEHIRSLTSSTTTFDSAVAFLKSISGTSASFSNVLSAFSVTTTAGNQQITGLTASSSPTFAGLTSTGSMSARNDVAAGNLSVGLTGTITIYDGAGSDAYYGRMTVPTLSASRLFYLPDAAGTLATIDGGQTFTSSTWHGSVISSAYLDTTGLKAVFNTPFSLNDMGYLNQANTWTQNQTVLDTIFSPVFASYPSDTVVNAAWQHVFNQSFSGTEPSVIMTGSTADCWDRENDTIYYHQLTGSHLQTQGIGVSTGINARFPYVLKFGNTYYLWVAGVADSNIYLYKSTDKTTFSIMNGGSPVVTKGGSYAAKFFNVSVQVLGNTWYMALDGVDSWQPADYNTLFSSVQWSGADTAGLTWNTNLTTAPIIFNAGNADLHYIPDRNAFLVIVNRYFEYIAGSKTTWKETGFYASLSDNLSLASSWHMCPNFPDIQIPRIDVGDAYFLINTGLPHYNNILFFNSDNTWGYQYRAHQATNNLTLNQFYDAVTSNVYRTLFTSMSGNYSIDGAVINNLVVSDSIQIGKDTLSVPSNVGAQTYKFMLQSLPSSHQFISAAGWTFKPTGRLNQLEAVDWNGQTKWDVDTSGNEFLLKRATLGALIVNANANYNIALNDTITSTIALLSGNWSTTGNFTVGNIFTTTTLTSNEGGTPALFTYNGGLTGLRGIITIQDTTSANSSNGILLQSYLKNNAGTEIRFNRIDFLSPTTTTGAEKGGINFYNFVGGTETNILSLSGAAATVKGSLAVKPVNATKVLDLFDVQGYISSSPVIRADSTMRVGIGVVPPAGSEFTIQRTTADLYGLVYNDSFGIKALASDSVGKLRIITRDTLAGRYGVIGITDTVERTTTASIATTNFLHSYNPGFYEVSGYLAVETGSALGAITVTLGLTDSVGATTFTPISSFVATGTGRTYFSPVPLRSTAANTYLTYATTIVGSPKYTLSLVCRRIY